MSNPIPGATPATISDLQRGDWAALFPHSDSMARIRRVELHRHGVWVTYDWGTGTRLSRRLMPAENRCQRAWR